MNYLVMWSGGIDSTYTMAKLLKEHDGRIHAHHICLVNKEGRQRAEENAIRRLMPKLQNIRQFSYTENLIDDSRLFQIPYDMARVCFEAGVVARGFSQCTDLIFDRWTIGTHKGEGHWQSRWNVISKGTEAAYWYREDGMIPPPKFELMPMVSKKEEMLYLKELGLLDDCWYCRTPVRMEPCGKCKTCIEVEEALNGNA